MKRVNELACCTLDGVEAVLARRGQNDPPSIAVRYSCGLDGELAPVVNAGPARAVGARVVRERLQERFHRTVGPDAGNARLDLDGRVNVEGSVHVPSASLPAESPADERSHRWACSFREPS